MPWTETDPVTERQKFVRLVLKGQVTMTQACQQFGISRKTGYKRVRADGGIKWAGSQVFVGEAFRGEMVGVEAVEDGLWHVHLGPLRLGVLHGRSRTIVPLEAGPSVTHVPGQADA